MSEGDLDLFRLESAASGMTEFSQRDKFSRLSVLKGTGWMGGRGSVWEGCGWDRGTMEVVDVRGGV